jgi:uncharacterized protein (DUF2235 family)
MVPPNATAPLECNPRRLVLCFDDTAYPFKSYYSNVLKMVSLVRKDKYHMTHYQASAHFSVPNALMCL